MWNAATDLEEERKGPAAELRLQGAAKIMVRELEPDQLQQGIVIAGPNGQPLQLTGLETLLRALSRRHAPLEQETQVHAIHEFLSFRRGHAESTDEVVARFEITCHRAQVHGQVQIAEPIMAWMLMSHLGIGRDRWPLILAPALGMLPLDQVQYQQIPIYLRRNGHLTDQNTDAQKNMRQQYFADGTLAPDALKVHGMLRTIRIGLRLSGTMLLIKRKCLVQLPV